MEITKDYPEIQNLSDVTLPPAAKLVHIFRLKEIKHSHKLEIFLNLTIQNRS
jgi:hypothetical protein